MKAISCSICPGDIVKFKKVTSYKFSGYWLVKAVDNNKPNFLYLTNQEIISGSLWAYANKLEVVFKN